MTAYEINVLRTDGTCEIYPVETEQALVPPESGDQWDLPDCPYYVAELNAVAMIEIVGGSQVAKPWYIWEVLFDFTGDAEDRTYCVEGVPAVPPAIPGTGTWWAARGSRGDEPACADKNALYIRRMNLLSIDPQEAPPTTCE